MKIYANTNKKIKYIDITVVFEQLDNSNTKIASVSLVHPGNIKKNKRWNNTKLAIYESFLDSVQNIITTYFEILHQGQSRKSYSYYFDFEIDDTIWKIRFRISDHKIGKKDFDEVVKSGYIIRHIIIGEKYEFKSYIDALKAIEQICKGISNGDLNVISKSYFNPNFE